ncbi:MAG TPA: arsenical pump-driving ATPase [Kiritimatiellia bacterium]|nr:arsenical pump-driving ATPase [Kiritimatiellia bacterium]HPS08483.1 arsenical pump-driving ATPase [Kiritimatiellia bacterium]
MNFLANATRYLFFTGKGGVGKTSLACATALALSDRGEKVLLVSTDPASNLDEVLRVKLSTVPVGVPEAEGLFAMNIDPEEAARQYREKVVGPYRGKLPPTALRSMEEQLSGACTMEIAAFDEFSRLLGGDGATAGFDHVIFDTAPTGHTLRLLSLPKAWTGYLNANTSGTSCLGPLAGLDKQRSVYERTLAALADGARTTLVLVSRAQKAALKEASRASEELAKLGVVNQRVMLNGLFQPKRCDDRLASALERRDREALETYRDWLASFPVSRFYLKAHNILGIGALRDLFETSGQGEQAAVAIAPIGFIRADTLSELVDDLAKAGRGVIMTMGKGGVGKTTIAAAIACELAKRGMPVRLSTTDPAAHVQTVAGDGLPNLSVSRIDPVAETRAYTDEVLRVSGKGLDADALALLEEDLRSPCTEEIAVFRAFARTVAAGEKVFVVLDTAPTGHTLLLLDASEAYHREVLRLASDMPAEVRELMPRLRDPEFTKVLVVTLPEATPVHEAAYLQEDLRRAQIEPCAWVVNQSFANSASSDPLLAARARNEIPHIAEVAEKLSHRTVMVPWVPEEPVGLDRLGQFFDWNG